MLKIVATPIGNLKDITIRAIESLKECDFIIAENPKNSLKLLNAYGVSRKPMVQFAEFNEKKILDTLVERLGRETGCLITDAGTPGVSDPGFRLARECTAKGLKIESVPGPSAAITALTVSGLPTDRFLFIGFLPRTENKLTEVLKLGMTTEATIIFFDSPFRIAKSVEIIARHFPEANLVVGRELTKLHEEIIRGKSGEVSKDLSGRKSIKGEIAGVISFK
ncbi:MAG: 16S rRNA (cytidine(1402)-2'-O)-methyltransferase [Acidobacteriaceae bacterium]